MAILGDFLTNQDPRMYSSAYGIIGVHKEYVDNYKRWEFLENSYAGGFTYRKGQYLTKYIYESDNEYLKRLQTTPYENHVKSLAHIYNSFLYRQNPARDFGNLESTPELELLMDDADLEGRTFDSFMRDVNIMSTVYGHVLVMVEKPKSNALTRAEELQQNNRPYLTMFTPPNILDWQFTRSDSGVYELTYLKLIEVEQLGFSQPDKYYIRSYSKESVKLEMFTPGKKDPLELIEEMPNELGFIPAVYVYANRTHTRGIGHSDLEDVAHASNSIYNDLSELEQLIRISNHPSLVKTPEVEASAGAGAIITVPNDTDANLKPYLLQPSGSSIDGILRTIADKVKMIDRMGFLGAIRAIETRQMSGVAMQSEFLLLDAKLNEKARNLELAEENIFRYFARWISLYWDGEIQYPKAFHIRDKNLDIDLLKKAAETNPADPRVKAAIDMKILELLDLSEDEMAGMNITKKEEQIQQELMTGKSNEEIQQTVPGTTEQDIVIAAAKAAQDN
jgi:hypothetical protein